MKPYQPSTRIAVRDSLEDEFSDDIEDDVFIRDGKMSRSYEENGLKRPLMAPRRKKHKECSTVAKVLKKKASRWKCWEPLLYGFITVLIILVITIFTVIAISMFPLEKLKLWLRKDQIAATSLNLLSEYDLFKGEVIPCTQINIHKKWSKAFSKMISESPVRKCFINDDSVEDIVIGYGIDDNFEYGDSAVPKCTVGKNGDNTGCEGGLIAIDGMTGNTLWQRWTAFNVFSLYCTEDLNGDGRNDCVAAGKGGLVIGVNGKNGEILWQLTDTIEISPDSLILVDLYTVNYIHDLDGDNIQDILAVHVEERPASRASHIKVISGKTGKIIRTIPTPYREEVFVPVQVITRPDGTEYLLVVTGGQNSAGGIYLIRTQALMHYTFEGDFESIYRNPYSGFMVPAVLVDITGDEIEDIIIASFNSTIYAFDGKSYEIIWTYVFSTSETVSSVVPGHFNNDNVTDFMVKYNSGPGFPIYYYSQTTILNGVNGQSLLDNMIRDSGGPYSLLAGLSISQNLGGDFFLHWQTECRSKFDQTDAYQFVPDSDVIQQSRVDTCMLRYNTSTVLKLYAIARHIKPPGAMIFSTDDLILQLNQTEIVQPVKPVSVLPIKHPKMLKKPFIREKIINEIMTPIKPDNAADISNGMSEENDIRKKAMFIPSNNMFSEDSIPDQGFENPNGIFDQEPKANPDDYENYFNYELHRKIPTRSKYSISRDVRSKASIKDYEDAIQNVIDSNSTDINQPRKKDPTDDETNPNRDPNQPETLWDLEMEKETEEATKNVKDYDYSSRKSRQNEINQNILASISNTGTLAKPLDDAPSGIDFIFVLNVRESEVYPPLLLPEDLACVEDKISGYKSFPEEDALALEKQFLKQCLLNRLSNLAPPNPKYESQIVVTRISITCDCGVIKDGEICSKLQPIEKQKWTGFMGNGRNGLYTHL